MGRLNVAKPWEHGPRLGFASPLTTSNNSSALLGTENNAEYECSSSRLRRSISILKRTGQRLGFLNARRESQTEGTLDLLEVRPILRTDASRRPLTRQAFSELNKSRQRAQSTIDFTYHRAPGCWTTTLSLSGKYGAASPLEHVV